MVYDYQTINWSFFSRESVVELIFLLDELLEKKSLVGGGGSQLRLFSPKWFMSLRYSAVFCSHQAPRRTALHDRFAT
jgi:hypothetical protein